MTMNKFMHQNNENDKLKNTILQRDVLQVDSLDKSMQISGNNIICNTEIDKDGIDMDIR